MPVIENTLQILGLWALVGYLLGSIPFGMVLAKLFGLGDLRSVGSGNIGATNVLRTGNKKAAALTVLLDAGKGALAVLLAKHFVGPDAAQAAGFFAFIGHLFPIWLGFKGGKGVATFLGVYLALAWPMGLVLCAIWLFAVVITRTSSMGALAMASMSPFFATWFVEGHLLILSFVMMVFIYIRHAANIKRIKTNTEPKIGETKPADP